MQNIQVLNRVFEVVKQLGKQGLPFRAHGDQERLELLTKPGINHGNFLEVILLLSKYYVSLKEHLKKAIEDSRKRKSNMDPSGKSGDAAKGRGLLVTFVSKESYSERNR